MYPPARIVCLTEETTETLYLLGEEHRIAGISGYTVRPPRARQEKPRVSAFTSADIPKILALEPDLVLAFSDLQADIVAALIRKGIAVHAFNQRDIAGILDMVRTLGALVGASPRAEALVDDLRRNIDAIASRAPAHRPKVYFEEWDSPMISAIGWVSELIAVAGGVDVFAGRSRGQSATERFVTQADVITAAPDIIVGSWCGKKFRAGRVAERPGFATIPAVQHGRLYEIKSPLILQPGPAALTDGLAALHAIIAQGC
ncbi:MAG TPA: cobalamin-binding protein [Rhizomicrobium sp.]|nr:cobalamin-binding protein [Rhizomicrobium sp.]